MKAEVSVATRSSLLQRLKTVEDDDSWREFVRTYCDLIRRLALSASLTQDEAEEVLQEVLISVARNIADFRYDRNVCSFKRWLSNITRWRITSQQRKRWRQKLMVEIAPGANATDLLEQIPNPEDLQPEYQLDADWGRGVLEAALARVKARANPKHYQIYFLHVLKGKPSADVCRHLNVSQGQVYLAKLRVGRLIEKELQTLGRTFKNP
jgi:RNA polymerase sigma factor (sigma-70 family)